MSTALHAREVFRKALHLPAQWQRLSTAKTNGNNFGQDIYHPTLLYTSSHRPRHVRCQGQEERPNHKHTQSRNRQIASSDIHNEWHHVKRVLQKTPARFQQVLDIVISHIIDAFVLVTSLSPNHSKRQLDVMICRAVFPCTRARSRQPMSLGENDNLSIAQLI